jgi:hypothetical protein
MDSPTFATKKLLASLLDPVMNTHILKTHDGGGQFFNLQNLLLLMFSSMDSIRLLDEQESMQGHSKDVYFFQMLLVLCV